MSSQNNSAELFERSLKIAPGGVHSPVRAFKSVGGTPVFFKSAEGPYLTSVEGKRYLDFCQSFGPLILGHRDPDVAKVVHETVDMAWSFGACEPYSLELAEWMTSRLPWVEKLRFVSSGTEAVMSALRVARAATNRDKILKFDGCYHGHADALLVKAGSGLAGESASDSAGVGRLFAESTLVAPLDDEASLEKVFELHKGQIAAVIIEPLPANYGLLEQRLDFLKAVARIAKAHGTLLIFDEVISGFRVALGGMAELTGIRPDLVTYGKVIGGGFPVGCYGGRKDLLDLVAPNGPVYQAGTLSANPVGMRAGLATLKKVEDLKIYESLEKKASRFQKNLQGEFDRLNAPIQISRQGSIFWIHAQVPGGVIRNLTQIPKQHAMKFKELFHACLDKGVYLAPSGYEVGFIGNAHTDQLLDEAVEKISQSVKETHG
ncbi:MAG: glutamate-1-semialdehyde 2,1-aminomutase [Proteobacteria bacterium]|nr:MAG: glutamate-1-semialdehyde 2,1-aminomutase [Pseudomonadota bacterium]